MQGQGTSCREDFRRAIREQVCVNRIRSAEAFWYEIGAIMRRRIDTKGR